MVTQVDMTRPTFDPAPTEAISKTNMIFPFLELPDSVRQNIYSCLGFQTEDQVILFTDKREKTETAIRLRERYNVDFNRSGQLSQPWNVSTSSVIIDLVKKVS
jgi:hypothetical protein